MKIFSDDGMLFDSTEACQGYEQQQAQHSANKAQRLAEVQAAKNTYYTLLNSYNEDYGGEIESTREKLWQQLLAYYD